MSEVAVSIETAESSAASVPERRFDSVAMRASAERFEFPTDRRYLRSSVAASLQPSAFPAGLPRYYDDLLYEISKRMLDIAVSLTAILILLPVMLIAAVAVKTYDRGPLFFSQVRVGKRGRQFRCFKFRSMVVNAEALKSTLRNQNEHPDQRTFKIMNDPRITPPGRILRRLSIDELPQLINVLRGEMSIVGPRPPLPSEVALYSDYDFQRLAVKPGLTCIWQISGRSRLPFPHQVRMDLDYIRTRSLSKDLSIILRTIPAVLSGDGAA